MGWRFRKTFGFGGIRWTATKKGLGYGLAFPSFRWLRFGVSPEGRRYIILRCSRYRPLLHKILRAGQALDRGCAGRGPAEASQRAQFTDGWFEQPALVETKERPSAVNRASGPEPRAAHSRNG